MRRFITVKEMKRYFPFSQSQLYKMAKDSSIPCYKVVGKIVFDVDEVTAWIKSHSVCMSVDKWMSEIK
jgi:predicted DNA-binding transcriptional regulator AlpA